MTEAKHSPAPFRVRKGHVNGSRYYLITDVSGDSIAVVGESTGDHPADEQAANCTLFVASPRLLAAANGLLAAWDTLEDPDDMEDQVDELRQAVAAAEQPE